MLLLRQQIWRKTWESLKEWWAAWWGEKRAKEPFDLEAALASPGSAAHAQSEMWSWRTRVCRPLPYQPLEWSHQISGSLYKRSSHASSMVPPHV